MGGQPCSCRRRRSPRAQFHSPSSPVMFDFDTAWKEALDLYFEPFMAFFFAQAHQEIDWTRGFEMLDKDLQQITRESEQGRRVADKLVGRRPRERPRGRPPGRAPGGTRGRAPGGHRGGAGTKIRGVGSCAHARDSADRRRRASAKGTRCRQGRREPSSAAPNLVLNKEPTKLRLPAVGSILFGFAPRCCIGDGRRSR